MRSYLFTEKQSFVSLFLALRSQLLADRSRDEDFLLAFSYGKMFHLELRFYGHWLLVSQ